MFRKIGFAFIGSLLLVGSAVAQTEGGSYSKLTSGGQKMADALYEAQVTSRDSELQISAPALSKNQIAEYRGKSGWGVAFKQMQEDGYFPEAQNLGQVVSSYNRQRHLSRNDNDDSSKFGRANSEIDRDHGGKTAALRDRHRESAHWRRFTRPVRAHRVDRPERPHRR